MYGLHLSIAGGLHNALLRAEELGCTSVQIFTKNQQQWRCPPLEKQSICDWTGHCKRLKIKRTVSHDSYLINLASPDEVLWRKSLELFLEELRRCAALAIPYLVTHHGAHMGAGEEKGIARIAEALNVAHQVLPEAKSVTTCLEITAGQGSSIGHRLEHLAAIIDRVREPKRVGVCLDTAHLFAAGYDFRGRRYSKFRRELESTVGLRSVKVIHVNDSKKPLGSRVDRHDHIGKGLIGVNGFKALLRDEAFAKTPKILETPKGKCDDGRDWDAVNLETLRKIAEG
jgi:deoxyribonuclease-4